MRIYRLSCLASILSLLWFASACSKVGHRTAPSPSTSAQQVEEPEEPEAATEPAKVVFMNKSHDFGDFSKAVAPQQTHPFVFTNDGGQPLIINQVHSSCGCLTVRYHQEPVQPGHNDTIWVTYNGTSMHTGVFDKTVSVYTNGTKKVSRLQVRGNMTK